MTDAEKCFLSFAEELKTLVVPHTTNLEKIRIGSSGDGGYVVNKLPGYDCLYSYGSNDDIKFENGFHELYGTDSFVYDHTIEGITAKPDHINFFKQGVWFEKNDTMDTVNNHIVTNGHSDKTNMFFKMDIEGCEWMILKDCDDLEKFSQLTIEFHMPNNILMYRDVILSTFRRINKSFTCTHVHGTNCPLQPWLDYDFPKVVEVTYIRNDMIETSEVDMGKYPIAGLDSATDPTRPDMHCRWWIPY